MSITFYDCQMAPSPRRTRILLAEKNIPHTTIEVDLMTGEQMGEEFRKINPDCTTPALKLEDGTILANVAGINAWAEASYPEPPLMGSTPLEKADIAAWQSIAEQEIGMAIPNVLRNNTAPFKDRALPGPINYTQIPDLAERGLKQVDAFMDKLEKHLEGRDFVAAGQLSVADITIVCFLDFTRVVGKKITEAHPNVMRWRTQMAERPSFNL